MAKKSIKLCDSHLLGINAGDFVWHKNVLHRLTKRIKGNHWETIQYVCQESGYVPLRIPSTIEIKTNTHIDAMLSVKEDCVIPFLKAI